MVESQTPDSRPVASALSQKTNTKEVGKGRGSQREKGKTHLGFQSKAMLQDQVSKVTEPLWRGVGWGKSKQRRPESPVQVCAGWGWGWGWGCRPHLHEGRFPHPVAPAGTPAAHSRPRTLNDITPSSPQPLQPKGETHTSQRSPKTSRRKKLDKREASECRG